MYFSFLIEDRSTEVLIKAVMEKVCMNHTNVFYDCKSFHGIGGYPKGKTPKDAKSGKLMNDLPVYLRGFNKALQSMPDSAIVIVLDNDDREPEKFRNELDAIAKEQTISVDHVFCIAVEEMEAWLLGDSEAVKSAYPEARDSVLREYVQDSICGTWECLANAVYPGGLVRLKKDCLSYPEIGAKKIEWAERIGACMNLQENRSPSFNLFLSEIMNRIHQHA